MTRHSVLAGLACALMIGLLGSIEPAAAQPAPAAGAPQVSTLAPPVSFDGDWDAVLAVKGLKLRLAFHIRTTGGVSTATWDSLDQGALGLPVTTVTVEGERVRLEMAKAGAVFEGRMSPDRQTISGQFTQGPLAAPMDLTRHMGPAAALRRPQTPQPPFPYRSEEVAWDSAPGVRLSGTLTLPPGPGPFPAVVLIHGSGAQDRDENIFGHKPFLVLADALTRRGVAVLRYDKRGVGRSTGRSPDVTSLDYAHDAETAVALLRARPGIDPARIGLIGHSEGGVIAPLVAAKDPKIAFVVMMAGSGVPGDELLLAQTRAVLQAEGMTPEKVAAIEKINHRIYDLEKGDLDSATVGAKVAAVVTEAGETPEAAQRAATEAGSPWIRWFMRYDPRPTLEKLRCPVLALDGSKDTQVLAAQNLPAIREALKADPEATVIEVPGVNHLFQTAGTGAPDEYATIEETLAPGVLKTIVDWVTAHAGAQ